MHKKFKIAVLLMVGLTMGSTSAMADWNVAEWLADFQRTKGVKPVDNEQYQTECGECHFAYQPGLLPAKSWQAIIASEALPKHFGVNAELDGDVLKAIRDYAVANAADNSYYKRSRKIAHTVAEGAVPLRITELRYIARKHKEIPEKMVKGNRQVKSLSFCDKCHTQAAQGIFDEDTVSIPNYPDWDDQ